MICHFPVTPPQTPYHTSTLSSLTFASMRMFSHHPPSPALTPNITLHWGTKTPQNQGPPLPLMSSKAMLWYTCIWSHGFLPVHSLVGGLVSGSTGWSSQTMFFFLWGYSHPLLIQSFCQLPHGIPELSLMAGSKHPHLHWSVAGRTSQGIAIAGSSQQVPLDHSNSVEFGVCRHDVFLGEAVPAWPFSLCSICCSFSSFGQKHFWVKNFETAHSLVYIQSCLVTFNN